MKILLYILAFCALSTPAHAEWSQTKTAREMVFAAALTNDWRQTLHIAETPWRRESNKLLGRRPHRDNVNIYFAGCLVGHALVAYALPENYAKIWQGVWTSIENNSSDNNVKVGHTVKVNMRYKLTHTIVF